MKNLKVFLLALIISTNSALAVDIPEVMKQSMASDSGMPSLLNLVVSMFLVIGLIYITGWIYTKLNILNRDKLNRLGIKDENQYRFKVLQSMPLGQQRQLHTIEIGNKVILIGSTPTNLTLLKEFDLKQDINDKDRCEENTAVVENKISTDAQNTSIDIDVLYKKYKK